MHLGCGLCIKKKIIIIIKQPNCLLMRNSFGLVAVNMPVTMHPRLEDRTRVEKNYPSLSTRTCHFQVLNKLERTLIAAQL